MLWIDHKCKVNSDELIERKAIYEQSISDIHSVVLREASLVFSMFSKVPPKISPKATGQGTPIRASAPYTAHDAAVIIA